ncbi:biliverdin-producing heme oxygenase [Luteimonas composti]|uniref:Biliverdin-producing heme oxygenase n=1 Tax=Luteimonas composti TaxID=398257 RepID=A0ABT6MNL3_9GAMM|nr:biliverdin-producing heme oxygenase [Luteimonas composti]MDH7452138.1 biliverdin-producing heme oxygenase [Luteimonas composti]
MIPTPLPIPAAPGPGPAHARLRAATAELHAGIDGLFGNGLDSPGHYRRYVLGMHRFTVDFEIATDALPQQSAWLANDLTWLALDPLAAQGVQHTAADAATRLGWRYVMAGSSMGARGLLRDARRLGHGEGRGATFLSRHAASDDWARLRASLQDFDADDAPRMASAEAGARAAFALVRTCFERSFDRIPSTAETASADDP